MTAERWQQIKQVFQAALERNARERAAFLDEACAGDKELYQEVESLLAAHDLPANVIDQALPQIAATLMESTQEQPLIGAQLGHYKISNEIGRGGMGEVYLARDTRLDRPVAIKLLPASFIHNADRVRRFQQEARAASLLNHPNIVTIHEVAESGKQRFIVSEFVEGKTLREVIRSGMKLDQALDVVMQTASALSAAHNAGIIHRDIKPENIMVRNDGYVKVLDFGLAKLVEQAQPGAQSEPPEDVAAKVSNLSTETGVVMGTVKYMSPEQARGQKVDHRTDIFSLGVVLYEMIAGRAPFEGETPSHTIVAILERQPQPIGNYLPNAPAELQQILNQALCKKREDRYETVGEMLIELQEVRQELQMQARQGRALVSSGSRFSANIESNTGRLTSPDYRLPITQSQPLALPKTSSIKQLVTGIKQHKLRTGIVAGVGLILIAALALGATVGLYRWFRPPPATLLLSFEKMQFTKLTVSGKATASASSPDGKYFAYSLDEGGGRASLWVQQVNTTSSVALVQPAEVAYSSLKFSPDGSYLYYVVLEKSGPQVTRLFQIPILGGTPRRLFSDIHRGVTFAPGGKELAFTRLFLSKDEYQVIVANLETLEERILITEKGLHSNLDWSPDGKWITLAKTYVDEDKQQYTQIVFINAETGSLEPLANLKMRSIPELLWLPDQSGLFITATSSLVGHQIWYVAYPGGAQQRVTNDLNDYQSISLTADGSTLVASQFAEAYNIWVAPAHAPTQARAVTSGLANYNSVNWFPDGRLITAANLTGRQELWQLDADGSRLQQVTFETGGKYYPIVCGGGRYIVFVSGRSGRLNLWRVNADGTGLTQLTDLAVATNPESSPDGEWVFFTSNHSGGPWAIWRVPLEGGKAERFIDGYARTALISPDRQSVAYLVEEGQETITKVIVRPLAGGAPIKTFTLPPTYDSSLTWTPDGKGFTFCDDRSGSSEIYYQPLHGKEPRKLTDFNSQRILSIAWSPDGKQFAFTRGQRTTDVVRISDFK